MNEAGNKTKIKGPKGQLFFDSILDNPFEGILAIDDAGVVTYVNGFFLNILQLSAKDLLGRKVWEALPGCRLYDTVLQGHSQWGENLKICGRDFLIMRFPVKQDGRIVGAVVKTIFPDMATAKGIANRVIHPSKSVEQRRHLFTCMDIIGETILALIYSLTILECRGTIVLVKIIADTSIFIAVALNEPEKEIIITLTEGHDLVAPEVLPFEIGNALTAMVKRRTLSANEALLAWDVIQHIAVDLRRINIAAALKIAIQHNTYAYDAYFLECAFSQRSPLLTLDRQMTEIAGKIGIQIMA